MYDAIRYGTAVYRNELASRVQQIGYRIIPAKHGFEIEGVSSGTLKRFPNVRSSVTRWLKEMEEKLGANFPTMNFPCGASEPRQKGQRHFNRRSPRTAVVRVVSR